MASLNTRVTGMNVGGRVLSVIAAAGGEAKKVTASNELLRSIVGRIGYLALIEEWAMFL